MAASDESFGEKENLVVDGPPLVRPGRYGHKGELVDGWETRRRRAQAGSRDGVSPLGDQPDSDWVIVRLGAAGVISHIDVDTTGFTGNYPPQMRLEACHQPEQVRAEQLPEHSWTVLTSNQSLAGDQRNAIAIDDTSSWTHVRLTIIPDGGVARLRVLGIVTPDLALLSLGLSDLARLDRGGNIHSCSDEFYSSPHQLLLPSAAASMGEGWETARRRGAGHDWLVIGLAAPAQLRYIEVDTAYYVCNASGEIALWGNAGEQPPGPDDPSWVELVPRSTLVPDALHRFVILPDLQRVPDAIRWVRADVFPDGGLSRIRVFGMPTMRAH